MITNKEFREWAASLSEEGSVAIIESSLVIQEYQPTGEETGNSLQVGGHDINWLDTSDTPIVETPLVEQPEETVDQTEQTTETPE